MAIPSVPPVMTDQTSYVHAAFEPSLFFYKTNWRSKSYHAGATLTPHHGNGSDFAGFASLLACPDPKRIDIRASVRTVPRQWLVRAYLERAAIRVYAIVDVSSSMFFNGTANMRQQVTEFVSSLAWSATRQGDAFGMRAANDIPQEALQVLPTFQPGTAHAVARQLTRYWQQQEAAGDVQGHRASAMPAVMEAIGPQRALVFLLSDFYWPETLMQQTLKAGQPHDVIPVILRDRTATEGLPAFGWARLRDMETGEERSWMLRRSLHQQIAAHARQQTQILNTKFLKAGTRSPLWLYPGWRAEDISRHLMETMT
ncbi:hypothetical protein SAMN05192566_0253 [Methylophilus rhizosphaerae]|uniref:DUF58 domain-containing protein n=1 Tax=Methylophilus rhizosphaerae TaxID=492660 RepID=A0A1G8ZFC4_9PROT|nr:hypothetical protein [Methylophilus rhizosphaerae]SDK13324.1 hypothetical protein SAMN05192566_0253 [Methylophilus rhizosphaerae]